MFGGTIKDPKKRTVSIYIGCLIGDDVSQIKRISEKVKKVKWKESDLVFYELFSTIPKSNRENKSKQRCEF